MERNPAECDGEVSTRAGNPRFICEAERRVYLGRLFGGERSEVAAGVVVASNEIEDAMRQIEDFSGFWLPAL